MPVHHMFTRIQGGGGVGCWGEGGGDNALCNCFGPCRNWFMIKKMFIINKEKGRNILCICPWILENDEIAGNVINCKGQIFYLLKKPKSGLIH